jgi:hypothetical protein
MCPHTHTQALSLHAPTMCVLESTPREYTVTSISTGYQDIINHLLHATRVLTNPSSLATPSSCRTQTRVLPSCMPASLFQIVFPPPSHSARMQPCGLNLVARNDKVNYPNSARYYTTNGDTPLTGGFTDIRACVTQDGMGMSGRGGQPCGQGFFNPRDTYS